MIKSINFFFYLLWGFGFFVFIYFAYKFLICNDISFAAPFGILLSALLASTAVLKTIFKNQEVAQKKEKYDKSEFYMHKSIDGLNQVYELLKNLNNSRIIWIQAARILDKTLELSSFITEENHKKVYELQKFIIRNNLYRIFNTTSDDFGLPLEFFAGLDNWKNKKSSEAIEEIDSITVQNQLSPESVIAIFQFLKFPKDYVDPLREKYKIPDNNKEIEDLVGIMTDASLYLQKVRDNRKKYLKENNDEL